MIEAKIEAINKWLRYHTDYDVSINLIAVYGTLKITVIKQGYQQITWIGRSLEKRLDEVIRYLEREANESIYVEESQGSQSSQGMLE